MRVRVVRRTCDDTGRDYFAVQKFVPTALSFDTAWQDVMNFQSDQYQLACEYAMTLSIRKESATQIAVFENGTEIAPRAPSDVQSAPLTQ